MKRLLLVLTVAALVAAACSSSGDDDGGDDGEAGSGGASEAPAPPGPGIDDEVVRIGTVRFDTGQATEEIGEDVVGEVNFEPNEVLGAFLAQLDGSELIGGRSIELVDSVINLAAGDIVESQREACLELTQDTEVFAVIAGQGLFGDPVLCVSEQGETLTIVGDGMARFFYEDSDGRLFTTIVSKTNAIIAAARVLHAEGYWDDVSLGVLAPGIIGGKEAAEDARPVIEDELGVEIAEWVELPADLAQVQSQMPTLVERMRASGADAVFLLGNIQQNNFFVSEAAEVEFDPDYYTTDQAQGVSQLALDAMTVPYEATGVTSSLSGSIEAGEPESDRSVECRDIIEAETGKVMDVVNDEGTVTAEYQTAMLLCDAVEVLRIGLEGADEVFSQRSFIDTLQTGVEIPLAGARGPGTFGPQKGDAPDLFRVMETDADCGCWAPVTDFAPVEAAG